MTTQQGAAIAVALLMGSMVAGCGDQVTGRPAHRPISVVYVAGDPEGPWAARTEGLTDGVKLAIAERDGLIGDRAVSIAVVPVRQRDGDTISAAIGAGRIVRDSRALAVLGTYTAPELAVSVPQFNGGELGVLQFGSGLQGLTAPEAPGEPGRYEPSGRRLALRAVPSDAAVGERVAILRAFAGAQVVAVTAAYREDLRVEAALRTKRAADALDQAKEDGDDPLPGSDPALTNPSPEIPDAERLAARIAERVRGRIVARAATAGAAKPTVVVIDPTEPDPTAAGRAALRGVRGPALIVDGADRSIDGAGLGRPAGSATYLVRRTIADATTPAARRIRARERELFGRDRGDAVVAGYRAARRVLSLASNQPERTIDRLTYATALTGAAPRDADLPAQADGDATLGRVELLRLRGGRFVKP